MIKGLGVDIVSIERIKNLAIESRDKFLKRCYTDVEIAYCESVNPKSRKYEQYAVRFAAKEAVSKALGTGFVDFNFRDIEIVNLKSGKPVVNLYKKAKITADALEISTIHVSLSHESDKAIAFVIAE